MATITADSAAQVNRPLGGVPYGNVTALPFEAEFLEGVFTDSDDATPVVATDKIILGIIPKGTTLLDAIIRVNAALGDTNSTLDIGFEYVDGVDSATVPQDVDYFCDAQANTAAFIIRATNTGVVPVTLPKAAYLIATCNTAAFLTTSELTGKLNVNVLGICDRA